ncbi:MAG: U32 family peptidase, partial [Sulfuricurvum sp.]|nr:U32 family peptidase [Sulfuricurvum sp.]
QVYYDMGARRIIAAREISLKDLTIIKEELPDLEIEVFVHGSMCFAYSGRCLISTLQSGRVPNRGSCANDCRFPYEIFAANPETGTLFKLVEEEGIGTYIMNSKDLNLASHMKEILESGCIDSVKVEGRTKSPYYAAITAKTYRRAIDDFYEGKFDGDVYQRELNTTQNRGFTDAYLINRPFEKHDTQNLDFTMMMGSHQVAAIVDESREFFECKYKTFPGDVMELVVPEGSDLSEIDNEIGTVFQKEGQWNIRFKQLIAENGKVWDQVHSGNLNRFKLPVPLPAYTFFRIPATEDMGTITKS